MEILVLSFVILGVSLLQLSAWAADNSLLERLLQQGADVHHQDLRGYSALHRAAAAGNLTGVQLLVDQTPS